MGCKEGQSEAQGCREQQQWDPRKWQHPWQRFRSPVQWEQHQMMDG